MAVFARVVFVLNFGFSQLLRSDTMKRKQLQSNCLMKPVEINPNDEWINMAMAGIAPQILMKSAYRSVMFFIGQRELEMQYKMNRIVAQCRQKCESMQEKFTEKLEQLHTAYQKMAKRCQMMEQEVESLSKDKQELQEKFSEKARQKRKLSRNDPDLFSNPAATMMDNRDPIRKAMKNDCFVIVTL
ncbi:hypothetical protein DKX38_017453 [Salix brachista]|uniref:Uncharacterized protein n=1 Tax=Salix brachista TaxID=2182728 RepID=A0A5N5KVC8_9ROSI|nr:hypothetical protein DKX38_017453 [Salix brachista]